MSFTREKRLLLGVLALLAPLPLPLNEPRPQGVISWLFLAAYLLAVGLFLQRAGRDSGGWLGPTALNVLGALYIPFLALDLARFASTQLLRPMMHLVLFSMVVKLFSLRRERDKWQVLIGLFFVFVTSMATSTSPFIVFYLAAFLMAGIHAMARFAALHSRLLTSGEETKSASSTRGMPLRNPWVTLGLLLATLAFAAPVFVLVPRLSEPFLLGRATSGSFETGFSDQVSLDAIGQIRASSQVALRIELEGPAPGELRLRGATFDGYSDVHWVQTPGDHTVRPEAPNRYRMAPGPASTIAQMFLEPINSLSLMLPIGTRTVEFEGRAPPLSQNDAGAVRLPLPPSTTLAYRVGMAGPVTVASDLSEKSRARTLDSAGITARIADLATDVAGAGTDRARARRIEQHLATNYGYTLDFVGRAPGDPIGDFLFTYQSGHCEYFATAMVLMLRSQGIPARFVTGFLGGEYNRLGYYIVRQSNAHAWVEAYLPDAGWTLFDPTPPAGRPAVAQRSLWSLIRQSYDFLIFRWDRYVLAYGTGDQAQVLARLRAFVTGLFERDGPEQGAGLETESTGSTGRRRVAGVLAAVTAFFAGVIGWWFWRRRPSPSATRVYVRLRKLAHKRGLVVEPSTSASTLRMRLVRRFPETALPAEEIVDSYLRESYGEDELSPEAVERLEKRLAETHRTLKRAS